MTTFSRIADEHLKQWLHHPRRKPLILRGARQTGKTTAVRRLAEHPQSLIELNLERPSDLALIRSCRSAGELIQRLEVQLDRGPLSAGTLLFLDEIQEHPEALKWLRFFYEDHPELAVVAAGSLLEVRLRDESLTFPVGRVEFLRLEPLTFLEFLRATEDVRLAVELEGAFRSCESVAPSLHELAMQRLREFLIVGGLPEAVNVWRETRSLVEVGAVHSALHQAYREDLLKYRVKGGIQHLEAALIGAPPHYGARFKVRQIAPGEKDRPIARALTLLEQAMVLFRVPPTASLSPPFLPRSRAAHKLLPLDIGLALTELQVRAEHLRQRPVESVLGGRVAEAFAGIQLLAANPGQARSLFLWTREGTARSNAEIDYLVSTPNGVLPVEVKASAAGSLKSMHRFLASTDAKYGLRLCSSPGQLDQLTVRLPDGSGLAYELRTVPLYLAELVAG